MSTLNTSSFHTYTEEQNLLSFLEGYMSANNGRPIWMDLATPMGLQGGAVLKASAMGPLTGMGMADEGDEVPGLSDFERYASQFDAGHPRGGKISVTKAQKVKAMLNGSDLVNTLSGRLGRAARQYEDRLIQDLFEYSFTGVPPESGWTPDDTTTVFSNSKPASRSGGTFDNLMADAAYSDSAKNDAIKLWGQVRDEDDREVARDYPLNMIICGEVNRRKAWESIATMYELDSANNNMNYTGPGGPGGWSVYTIPLTSDSMYYWWVVNSELLKDALRIRWVQGWEPKIWTHPATGTTTLMDDCMVAAGFLHGMFGIGCPASS